MFSFKNAISLRWRFLFLYFCNPILLIAQPDLVSVDLNVRPDFNKKSIQVRCDQVWKTGTNDRQINLLLYPQLNVDTLLIDGHQAEWKRDSSGINILLSPNSAEYRKISLRYHGVPLEAPNPPWDGGFVWTKDSNNKPWLSVAIQDKGAAVWWPAPANYSDHPDSARVTCTYPAGLFFKGNGQLVLDRKLNNKVHQTTWKSTYPINTYNISLNIGNYGIIRDTMTRRDGTKILLEYYPLKPNMSAAARQFRQVKPMLDCYEKAFGKYPYENDGFSLVEVPYAGMEHQGAIAYGNGYKDGYLGQDYSAIGLDFDFILIHESGHQWWGNSVTASTARDKWIQETFCTYAEYIYVQCIYGDKTAVDYINAKKRLVKNQAPILSNKDSGIDMYVKGALMLYTLEQLLGQSIFQDMLKEFALSHQYTPLTTAQLIEWFSRRSGLNLDGFFRQYLERADIPVFEYQISTGEGEHRPYIFRYRISNAVQGFMLPVKLISPGLPAIEITATANWQEVEVPSLAVYPDENASYFSAQKLKN